jgi:hypothetical protein
MKVKLFTRGGGWGKAATQFEKLEADVNSWLEEHPGIVITEVHRMSQPTFGWGQLAVAVWYEEPQGPAED